MDADLGAAAAEKGTKDTAKDTVAVKDLARKAAFGARKAAFTDAGAADIMARANGHLARVLADFAGQALGGYMPMRTEIDPLPAMHAHSGALGVPVIMAAATPLRFAVYHADAGMVPGAFGALIPAALEWMTPTVLIVPLLAYDARGYRLGYGGGFYDRTLAQLRAGGAVTAIGFAFAAQAVAQVPIDATDQPLDMIVTEAGVLRV
jgi:5-formyltetrahydrofolate cyclo-ligase